MSDYSVTRGARPADPHLRLRLAALTAVIVGVILVALAAFLFSYTGIRQIALQAGVSPHLARLYPLMFDAMLIITCSAVLATRTAGWGTKTYVWACLLLVVGAAAVGNALYATSVHLTGEPARATIAVIPWVLLLLGFGVWLVMLRHWRRFRTAGAVDGTEADRVTEAGRDAQADRNGHAGRAAPAGQPERVPQAAPAGQAGRAPHAAPAGEPERAPQAAPAGQTGRAAPAAPAMAAGAAAGGAAGWAASRGATSARTRAPQVGIDNLLEQQAARAPERAPAADSATAADRAAATGQGRQRTATPGERQPAGTTAPAASTAVRAAAGTAAGAAAGIAAGNAAGATTGTRPGTPGDTRPVTPEETGPGTAEATAATAAGAKPGTTGTTPGTSDTDAGAEARAGAGATGAADAAESGRNEGGKDKAPAQERRRRLGGLLEMPVSADDEEGSVRILPAQAKDRPGDAASREDSEAGEEEGTPAGAAAAATEPDPANPPAPLPHFDRPRSTPTPPRETGADGE